MTGCLHAATSCYCSLSACPLDMAGVACVKKAYKIYKERGYKCQMLAAAYRTPLHWLGISIGGDMVLTMPYKYQVMFTIPILIS